MFLIFIICLFFISFKVFPFLTFFSLTFNFFKVLSFYFTNLEKTECYSAQSCLSMFNVWHTSLHWLQCQRSYQYFFSIPFVHDAHAFSCLKYVITTTPVSTLMTIFLLCYCLCLSMAVKLLFHQMKLIIGLDSESVLFFGESGM